MYLANHDDDDEELGGIGSKLKKAAKKVKKTVAKVSVSQQLTTKAAPRFAPQAVTDNIKKLVAPVVEKVTAPLTQRQGQFVSIAKQAIAPIANAHTTPIVAANKVIAQAAPKLTTPTMSKLMKPLLDAGKVVSKPLSFREKGRVKLAPAASIPERDIDGTELIQAERNSMIEAATPLVEPIASGYYPETSPEQVFEPDVPEMILPDEIPAAQPPPKKNALPLLGGLLLLLNFL